MTSRCTNLWLSKSTKIESAKLLIDVNKAAKVGWRSTVFPFPKFLLKLRDLFKAHSIEQAVVNLPDLFLIHIDCVDWTVISIPSRWI